MNFAKRTFSVLGSGHFRGQKRTFSVLGADIFGDRVRVLIKSI